MYTQQPPPGSPMPAAQPTLGSMMVPQPAGGPVAPTPQQAPPPGANPMQGAPHPQIMQGMQQMIQMLKGASPEQVNMMAQQVSMQHPPPPPHILQMLQTGQLGQMANSPPAGGSPAMAQPPPMSAPQPPAGGTHQFQGNPFAGLR